MTTSGATAQRLTIQHRTAPHQTTLTEIHPRANGWFNITAAPVDIKPFFLSLFLSIEQRGWRRKRVPGERKRSAATRVSRERVVERVWRNADDEVEEGGSDGGLRCSCLQHTWTIPKCRAWPRVAWRSQATSVPWPLPPIVADGTVLRTDRTQNLPDVERDRRQRLASPCARSTSRVTHGGVAPPTPSSSLWW